MAGEVGLSGEIRPVNRIEQRISEAEKLGFKKMIIPEFNKKSLQKTLRNIEIIAVKKVEEAFGILFQTKSR
jgi:DNA repair protein RadA/Sms